MFSKAENPFRGGDLFNLEQQLNQELQLGDKLDRWKKERPFESPEYDSYPGLTVEDEKEVVDGLYNEIKRLVQEPDHARYVGRFLSATLSSAITERNPAKGAEEFIYGNLDELITNLYEGKIDDFDAYRDCELGDKTLSMLGRLAAGLEMAKESSPEYERKVFYPEGIEQENAFENGAVLFFCGYGAQTRPYEGIFERMNVPVICYTLSHKVINEDPDVVQEGFDEVAEAAKNDPNFDKVTHVIGNSTGTMLASNFAVNVLEEEPERNLDVALIQTGASWQEALKRTRAKFAQEFREKLDEKGIDFDDFSDATREYNPIDLSDGLAKLINEGRLDFDVFSGGGDRMITPAHEVVDPLLNALDEKGAEGKYNAYNSGKAGHQSATLFFLWLATEQETEWGRVFNNFKGEITETPERDKYRDRRKEVQEGTGIAA